MTKAWVTALLSVVLTVAGGLSAGAAPTDNADQWSGSGSARTPTFRLPDQWSLRWSFDCSRSAEEGPGVFSVQAVDVTASGTHLDLRIPRLLRFDTAGSGLERYDHGGVRAFLRIATRCSWSLRAERLAP